MQQEKPNNNNKINMQQEKPNNNKKYRTKKLYEYGYIPAGKYLRRRAEPS